METVWYKGSITGCPDLNSMTVVSCNEGHLSLSISMSLSVLASEVMLCCSQEIGSLSEYEG